MSEKLYIKNQQIKLAVILHKNLETGGEKMKAFELPSVEVLVFDVRDILTTSTNEPDEPLEPGELPGDDLE